MKRVLVIGSCGAGKSFFSKRLGAITGLPTIHLDRIYWRPGWVEPSKEEWRSTVAELLRGESWIIDGNYGGTMDMRLAECDTVFFLDFPRHVCTWRVIRRSLVYYGRTRPDLGDGCPERFDWDFIKWTWNYPARSRASVEQRLAGAADHVNIIRLRSGREVERYIEGIANNEYNERRI